MLTSQDYTSPSDYVLNRQMQAMAAPAPTPVPVAAPVALAGTPAPSAAPWTDAQISAMWHDGIKGNAEAAQKELDAWRSANPHWNDPPPVAVVPPPVAAPPPPVPVPLPVPPVNTPPSTPPDPAAYVPPLPGTKEYYEQQVNKTFQPGYEYNKVPSSLLDGVIGSILQEQQTSAQEYLDRGKARGIYNDVGYNAGEAALVGDRSAGSADLTSLGVGALDKYRTEMDQVSGNAYLAASGYSPGLTFSLDPYVNEVNAIEGRAKTNIGGDLRNLVGGKNYFDFSNLTSKAGTAQGALNLRDADVATALAERNRKNSITRGLGSQGAF